MLLIDRIDIGFVLLGAGLCLLWWLFAWAANRAE